MIEIDSILEVENHISDVDAVIFDLDDTLYSEKEYVRSGYRKIAEYLGFKQMEDEMWSVFESGGMAIDEVLKSYNLLSIKEEALQIYRCQKPDIHAYAGVINMIGRIRENRKVGIITDGRPEGQRAKMEALGLKVDKAIITDELGGIEYRKPNKTAYCLMKEYLCVEFERMVYVGDNICKDFIAPENLGMKTIWFKNKDGLYSNLIENGENLKKKNE